MSKISKISAAAMVVALLSAGSAVSFADDANHNFQEARSQRDVVALHEAEQQNQTAAAPTLQASAPTSK